MNVEHEIAWLRSLKQEEQALQDVKESSLGYWLYAIGVIGGIVVAVWYLIAYKLCYGIGSFIIAGALGLAIFIPLVVISAKVSGNFLKKWDTYNKIITNAQKCVRESTDCVLIDDANVNEEKVRIRKLIIEKDIENNCVGDRDFKWHSTHWCWGCGSKLNKNYNLYPYSASRSYTERKKLEYSTTVCAEGEVFRLCPDCYNRITANEQKEKELSLKNSIWSLVLLFIVIPTISISLFSISHYLMKDNIYLNTIGEVFGWMFIAMVFSRFCLGISLDSLITYLLLKSFSGKYPSGETKWDFDRAPKIRYFKSKSKSMLKNSSKR